MKPFCFTVLSLALYFLLPSCNSNSADEPVVPPVEDEVELADSEFDFAEDASTLFNDAIVERAYIDYTLLELNGKDLHYDIDKYGYANNHYGIGYKAYNSVSEIDTIPNLYNSYKIHFPEGIDWQKQTLIVVAIEYSNEIPGNTDGLSVYQKDGKFKIYINVLPIPGITDELGRNCQFVVIGKPGVKTSHIRSYALPLRSHIDYYENK